MELDEETVAVIRAEELLHEASVLLREYEFYLGQIRTRVKIRIYYDAYRDNDPYRFDLSHYIHTPVQAGPYIPSAPFTGSEASALSRGIDSLTRQYKHAVSQGHAPSEGWLVKASD